MSRLAPAAFVACALAAPAKVNLYLHVGPLAADGYHPLVSLMSFADVGDRLELHPADTTGFHLHGPFAGALAGEDPQGNLAWRAVQALLSRSGIAPPPFRLSLYKALPVAAGLGGGSSDAGAALRLVRDTLAPQVSDAELEAVAAELGADGPACLAARPVLASGRGDRLSAPPAMPMLDAVLVNPGVTCPTGAVYRAFDRMGSGGADELAAPSLFEDVEAAITWLAGGRNDLEAPAATVAPAIVSMLDRLRGQPETLLARLSGSGATGFALCADAAAANALAARLARDAPGWWAVPCRLGGARPEPQYVVTNPLP